MKRTDLIKFVESHNWYLLRHGSNHDIYTNGNKSIAIPRHKEINEMLAKQIKKEMGL